MFKGTYTAIVTPFDAHKKIDESALKRLIEEQIQAGIDGIVPCGTTGESPTLDEKERALVIRTAIELAHQHGKGKVKVIAGTGSNSTQHTIELTQRAKDLGADAALVVVPYYNKPTQEGLYQHFRAVAEQGRLPVMLYNVPSRTSCDLLAATVVRLQHDVENIVAIKEAAGSTERIAELRAKVREDFSILSGDDALTLPFLAAGADGVVSVASNVLPREMAALVTAGLSGDFSAARQQHLKLREFFSALFVEANPIPVKAVLAILGKIKNELRLPLVQASESTQMLLRKVLHSLGMELNKSVT